MTEDQPLTTKIEKDDGTTAYAAIDGKEYKTRAGAWKRSQKLMDDGVSIPITGEPLEAVEGEGSGSGPEWASFDLEDLAEGVQVVPGALKSIRRSSEPGSGAKKTKKQMQLEREASRSILMTGYRTGDVLLTRYGVAVLDDPDYRVTHTEADYEWISDVTQSFLDDRGVNIAAVIGPGGMAAIANAYWFGKPVVEIRAKAGRPIIPAGANPRNWIRRLGSKIPFLRRRAKKKWKDESAREIMEVVEGSIHE